MAAVPRTDRRNDSRPSSKSSSIHFEPLIYKMTLSDFLTYVRLAKSDRLDLMAQIDADEERFFLREALRLQRLARKSNARTSFSSATSSVPSSSSLSEELQDDVSIKTSSPSLRNRHPTIHLAQIASRHYSPSVLSPNPPRDKENESKSAIRFPDILKCHTYTRASESCVVVAVRNGRPRLSIPPRMPPIAEEESVSRFTNIWQQASETISRCVTSGTSKRLRKKSVSDDSRHVALSVSVPVGRNVHWGSQKAFDEPDESNRYHFTSSPTPVRVYISYTGNKRDTEEESNAEVNMKLSKSQRPRRRL